MKPTIGRVVHFVTASGTHVPAIVTALTDETYKVDLVAFCADNARLCEPGPEGTLQVYPEQPLVFSGSAPVHGAMNDETEKITGTWHWPERDEA
jgi:hypothetical protein